MDGLILRQFLVSQMLVFAYLVGCETSGEAVVIDPAADTDRILAEAERSGIRILKIINTHGHADHIMGNAEMKHKTGSTIVIHEDDLRLMNEQPQEMFRMFGGHPSPPADETVTDGELIRVGEITLSVIHTPGHTPGGMCLRVPGGVFTGDTLFTGGIGRTDLPGGSLSVLLKSIREKLLTLPEKTVVYPGHGYGPNSCSTIGDEKRSNPYLNTGEFL